MEESVEQLDMQEPVTTTEMEFYAVSQKKFLIMFLGTFGIYSIYWFYKHWSLYKESENEAMWPVMRSIFQVFFTHSLFSLFEMKYQIKTGEAPKSINHIATIFVVTAIIGNIGSNLSERGYGIPFTYYSLLIALPITCWCLYQAQSLANYASDDVEASSNNKLTSLNYIWLALGAVIWLLNIVGLFVVASGA
ncbi:hypothetical protein HII17_05715 [Thalassotalea sp. M1531]|uniref:DUF4234 domain-containing protein n=1 Tax=Thalassotalea algicola TaxID=2716224 RepID=A0A7Y0LB31_9GAMM|nr:hypothetical protein [Thalassotalea algicola]NMP31057.1 hypothetical protein [Thalassotalea algicola]